MARDPRILVFQHIDIEHPGIFRDFLAADGIAWDAVELDAGEAIPPLADYDALWVMGGPMDVWEEDSHPWLKAEKAAIRTAVVERGLPYFGLCLGHQLLAEALGGRVGPAAQPEIGMMTVDLTETGRSHPLFAGFTGRCPCLQWHGAEVLEAPGDALVLAESTACRVQAMAIGEQAFSLQYHVELTAETVPLWGAVPAYKTALEKALGAGAQLRLEAEAAALMAALNADSRRLYDNVMAMTRKVWAARSAA